MTIKPMTLVIKKSCLVCYKQSEIEVDALAYNSWISGKVIQEAFPDMPAGERELIKTGIDAECWEVLCDFG